MRKVTGTTNTAASTEAPEADGLQAIEPAEFEQIRSLARRAFGLDLRAGKEQMVSSRLRRLVRDGGFRSFRQYCRHIAEDSTGRALAAMIDALATNHTAFLREPSHFDLLCREVVPLLSKRDSIDVWCAACSTGEEAWTLAFVLNDAAPSKNIRVLGTDISNKALEAAQAAVYPADRCSALPPSWILRYLRPQGRPPSGYCISPEIRRQVTFLRANLLQPPAARQCFPVIFCRNVMIYFDPETQERAIAQLAASLEPGGYLFVGHAESLARISHGLEYVRPAVYRKTDGGKWGRSR